MFESVCELTVAAVQTADPFRLAAALARVSQDQLAAMSADEAECVVAATQRAINALSARQAVAVTRYTEHVLEHGDAQRAARYGAGEGMPVGAPTPQQQAAAALAPILRIAPRTMVTRIDTAHTLSQLPRTAAMAWAGDLEPYRVSVITRAARTVEHPRLGEFEARLHHGDIRELPGSRVKTRAELIAARLAPQPNPTDPTDAEDSDEGSGAQRQVRVSPGEQAGLTHWDAQLPAEASVAMWAAVETLAARYRAGNPDLTVAQSRADALADLVLSDVHVSTTATLIIPTTSAPTTSAPTGAAAESDPDPGEVPAGHAGSPTAASGGQPAPAATGTASDGSAAQGRPVRSESAGSSSEASTSAPSARAASTGTPADGPVADDPPTNPDTGPDPDPESEPARGRPVGALTKLTPPPCDCAAQRSRPWLDLLDPFAHPSVIVGGSWVQDRPDPPLHARFQTVVRQAREVDANPNLARDWHGRTWFVPKPVLIPPVGMLLPAQVNAILANPDTHLRLGAANPATGAVEHLDEAHLPTRRRPGPAGPSKGWHLPLPRLRHPRRPLRPRPRHPLPSRPHRGGEPADTLPDPPRVQTPRRLDRHHDPRRHLHLEGPQRTQPHHPPPQPARRRRLTT